MRDPLPRRPHRQVLGLSGLPVGILCLCEIFFFSGCPKRHFSAPKGRKRTNHDEVPHKFTENSGLDGKGPARG